MRHAVLVTAFKDFDALLALAQAFDSGFYLYIHVDRKSRIHRVRPDVLLALRCLPQVRLIQSRYAVNWGGIRHLYAVLGLAAIALRDSCDAQFFLWLTGQDYPVRSGDEFTSFFHEERQHSFLNWFRLPASIWSCQNGGLDRTDYWHLYDVLNIGKCDPRNQRFLNLQRTLRLKRPYSPKLPALHGGFGYWSLNRAAMTYVLDQTKYHPALLRRLRHCFCAEELYVHTLLMASPLADSVINDDMRYVEWGSTRSGVHPAILDESDFDPIRHLSAFFARKFDSRRSLGLRRMIDEAIGSTRAPARP